MPFTKTIDNMACGVDATHREFYARGGCKACARMAARTWTIEHPEQVRQKRADRVAKVRAMAIAAKSVPCSDCHQSFNWWMMQFDHVSGIKEHNISRLVARARSMDVIMAEMAKCEVVCANCHANRTYTRLTQETQNGVH